MVSIHDSRVVAAPASRVWEVVSDVDRDPEYWPGLNSVRNIRKEKNVVEREVTVGFMGQRSLQKVELRPGDSVELTMIEGPLKGSRRIRLLPVDGGSRTEVDISWDFRFSGVPVFARPFVKSQLERGTKEALTRIAEATEGRKRRP